MAKNKRQPYAVSEKAGEQTSAESWGTGEKDRTLVSHNLSNTEFKVVLLHVFLVSLAAVHTEPVKQLSVISAVPDECSLLQKFGASGIRRSIWGRSEFYNHGRDKAHANQVSSDASQPHPPSPPAPFQPSSSPAGTASPPSPRSPLSSQARPSKAPP